MITLTKRINIYQHPKEADFLPFAEMPFLNNIEAIDKESANGNGYENIWPDPVTETGFDPGWGYIIHAKQAVDIPVTYSEAPTAESEDDYVLTSDPAIYFQQP